MDLNFIIYTLVIQNCKLEKLEKINNLLSLSIYYYFKGRWEQRKVEEYKENRKNLYFSLFGQEEKKENEWMKNVIYMNLLLYLHGIIVNASTLIYFYFIFFKLK